MSIRLQVLFDERELRALQRAARANHESTSAWVRRALRQALAQQAAGDPKSKLAAIRAAAAAAFPAPDIQQMNAEIARGYAAGQPR